MIDEASIGARARARCLIALALVVGAIGALPTSALAHATLLGTEPPSGTVLVHQPRAVVFRFGEGVEGAFGAIRVVDHTGKRVEAGDAFHPDGDQRALATRLQPGLPRGTYTATYRVISADGHPVSGGAIFSVGRAGTTGATVAQLLAQRDTSGPATEIGFGAVRVLQDASLAFVAGGLLFLLAVWASAFALVARDESRWHTASEAFDRRLRRLLLCACGIGAGTAVLGICFQGATAAGTSLWSALDAQVVRDVLETRFGVAWALKLLAWLVLGVALVLARRRSRRVVLAAAALPLAFLLASPALSGHAGVQSPVALLLPMNVLHVAAMCAWTGGLAVLLLAVPVATRRLERPDRTRLLASLLVRFSPIALASVALLLATGIVQSIVEVGSFGALLDTAFGRAVLIKLVLLLGPLVALGAYNRQRLIPRLQRLAATGAPSGRNGVALRRTLRIELALIVVVLGVTAALVSYAPGTAASSGPVDVTQRLGPAQLQLTVDPARVGINALHLYLTDARTGQPWDRSKQLTVELLTPGERAPIRQPMRKAGPGHYVSDGSATFGTAGTWRVVVVARVSDFDQYQSVADVEIR